MLFVKVKVKMDDFIPTKGSQIKEHPTDNFKVIKYESHKPKRKNDTYKEAVEEKLDIKANELNIKRAKFEIMKFGMSGFDQQKKEEAKIQLAIKLGAKPPKNKYRNYKELIEEKKREKLEEEKTIKLQQSGKNKMGKSIAKGKSFDRKRRKGKETKGLLDVYGKVDKNKVNVNM
ncbi:uncharacterized protein C1orf131 homolog [Onthophagus taurus]|uniref:uncharacterized protein C1orf131 homolog n=1 Tax=Onthophagus taurus TaxID=166361 RepID=UPI000C20CB46|nr:uncharacterized protein C1orf131 homolog [Onthophagus taurus]